MPPCLSVYLLSIYLCESQTVQRTGSVEKLVSASSLESWWTTSALLESSPTSLNTRSFSCGSSGHRTRRPNKLVKSMGRNRMIGGTVYQLCYFCHKNDHIAITVDFVYYGNPRDISDHCGSVIIRMSHKVEALWSCINKILAMQKVWLKR